MNLVRHTSYNNMSKKVAKKVAEAIENKPNIVICFATGSTPIGLYNELVKLYEEEKIDFSEVVSFNLDEYYGLSEDNPQSYRYFMWEKLFSHININKDNIYHIHAPKNKNIKVYCEEYERNIQKHGGFDILIDGIGLNGHLGFNEPNNELNLYSHVVDLTPSTIKANSRFFSGETKVPRKAITIGMSTIFNSEKVILLASGKHKASIVYKILNSNLTTQIPASLLHLHSNCELHVDNDALTF